ncbi:MAG: tetratricopeptide repeat protein [Bacteroidota bacterium]
MTHIIRIEDFKNGLLNEITETQFVNDLQNDRELEREYKLSEAIDSAIGDEKTRKFEASLNMARRQYERKPSYSILYKAAASFAILAVVGSSVLFYINGHQSRMEKISSMYYETYKPINGLRSADPGQNLNVKAAFDAFRKADYDKAIQGFEKISKTNPANQQVRFYQAVSYLQIEKPNQAMPLFLAIIASDDNFYKPLSDYYLGMCYLRIGDKNAAIRQFEKVSAHQGGYQGKATRILQDLKAL